MLDKTYAYSCTGAGAKPDPEQTSIDSLAVGVTQYLQI